MIAYGADICLAFHPFLGRSKGTKDCATQALKAGIPTWLVVDDGGEPRRLHLTEGGNIHEP